jgi:hypothetical protein
MVDWLDNRQVTAKLAAVILFVAPALWNGYPLLQYDTGGYLARWYEGYLVPSRSTVFGLFLHFGEGWHFWPELLLQAGCAVWIISLVLRVTGPATRAWHISAIGVGLSVGSALPFLSSALLTDVFAGLGVLALYLLVFHEPVLRRGEQAGLFFVTAFAAATHSATLGVLVIVLGCAVMFLLCSGRRWFGPLVRSAGAIGAGAAMLIATNFAFSGQLSWTPGGFGIVFGRMLQDGIVKRYLDDHCPKARLRLCPYRDKLPTTADEFLWNGGPFTELGRFNGLGEEMRFIVLDALRDYPGQQLGTALVASAAQLRQVATGYGMHDQIEHTYGIIERFIPLEIRAMRSARQQRGELRFDLINRIHVPVALGSMLVVIGLLVGAWVSGRFDSLAQLSATVAVAILANAFACGALSGPHDRYGARIIWIATLTVAIAILRLLDTKSTWMDLVPRWSGAVFQHSSVLESRPTHKIP